jgi:uncharacterized metal-binding protein
MPSGKVHSVYTGLLALVSLPAGDYALTVGILSGLILSPDLDVDDGYIGLAHLRRFGCVGNVASVLWRTFWYPYSKLVPHRSPISHSFIVGTTVRVGYLFLPLLLANIFGLPLQLPTHFGSWFIGLCLSDGLHVLMDWISSKTKR